MCDVSCCNTDHDKIANLADIFTSRLLAEIPPALSALLTALLSLPSLHTVNLSDNAFGLNTQAPLVDFLSKHTPLQHLILNNNGLGPRCGVLVADALTALHGEKEAKRHADASVPDLETIVCGRNRLENGSMEAWAQAFSAHRAGMREVKMVQNGIRPEGVSHLLREGLSHARGLRILDLQDNTFTALGSRILADIVPAWAELRELGVGDCLLSARGGLVLGAALAKGANPHLQTLRLQYNEIDAKGLAGFAHAATTLPALQRVELNGNKFDEEDLSVEKLRELLAQRKEAATEAGVGGDWGLDSLSDLEEESEEDEADEDNEEREDRAEKVLKEADEAENETVSQKADGTVDELANKLDQTELR